MHRLYAIDPAVCVSLRCDFAGGDCASEARHQPPRSYGTMANGHCLIRKKKSGLYGCGTPRFYYTIKFKAWDKQESRNHVRWPSWQNTQSHTQQKKKEDGWSSNFDISTTLAKTKIKSVAAILAFFTRFCNLKGTNTAVDFPRTATVGREGSRVFEAFAVLYPKHI